MEQYEQNTDVNVNPPTTSVMPSLQAVVQPETIELKWDNKILRVSNPAHVQQLMRQCEQMRTDLQQLKERHTQLQQSHAQLLRMVQQIQNQLSA
jgi:hypothetical protein